MVHHLWKAQSHVSGDPSAKRFSYDVDTSDPQGIQQSLVEVAEGAYPVCKRRLVRIAMPDLIGNDDSKGFCQHFRRAQVVGTGVPQTVQVEDRRRGFRA